MPNEWARLNLFITTRKQLSAIGLAERNRKRTRQLGRRRFLHQYERGMLNIGPIFGSIGKVFRKPRQDLASISSEFSLTLISCSRVAFTCRSLLSARSDRRRRSFSMRIESLISFTSFCNLQTAKKHGIWAQLIHNSFNVHGIFSADIYDRYYAEQIFFLQILLKSGF